MNPTWWGKNDSVNYSMTLGKLLSLSRLIIHIKSLLLSLACSSYSENIHFDYACTSIACYYVCSFTIEIG